VALLLDVYVCVDRDSVELRVVLDVDMVMVADVELLV
jgi:hypothetical protein